MPAKATTVFACQACGAASPKWLGRCPECGEWNSFVEEVRAAAVRAAPGPASQQAVSIGQIDIEQRARLTTGLDGLDRVLGGGLVPGSVVLLGGEPGIGKSTLLLQAGRGLAVQSRDVLYASAEESAPQVRLRGGRLGIHEERLLVLSETDVSRIIAEAEARSPAVLVIDSIQAVREPSLASAPGTVSQVRAAASELTRYAKSHGVPVLLVGHVTKDGSLAGPKSLEHLVDAVVSIEGDRGSSRRLLRATKNRFGPVDEIALYEMTGEGLSELPNASAALLAERRPGLPGSAVTAAREGARSVLVEIQALVGGASAGSPRRVAIGVDGGRLALLLAVLEGSGLALSAREVFVSCTGGSRSASRPRTSRSWRRSFPPRVAGRFPTAASSSARSACWGRCAVFRPPSPGSRRRPLSDSAAPTCRRATPATPRDFRISCAVRWTGSRRFSRASTTSVER